ncbi:multivesicular body subunit 12 [Holotrichia oblita]|uniref:Multivesicular body subunit 12 n=1 Tax=Holotrichia oblita TaxID=644536 RepID=A0ACB9SXZ1_HOLOL|nr:multivesicular body subunit 12 [Holotrichia oblita]
MSNKILNTLSRTLPDDRPITALQVTRVLRSFFFDINIVHEYFSEINGVVICYKMGNAQDTEAAPPNPNGYVSPSVRPPDRPPKPNQHMYPVLNEGDHDYEILNPPGYVPARPAPQPPTPTQHSTHTLNTNFNGLEGVPFVINSRYAGTQSSDRGIKYGCLNSLESLMCVFAECSDSNQAVASSLFILQFYHFVCNLKSTINFLFLFQMQIPIIKAKTMQQLLRDYDYPFTVERQT